MDIEARLIDYHNSLSEFQAKDHPSGQIGDIFNALLAEVKKQHGDDPVVSVIQIATKGQTGKCTLDAGTLRTATQQLLQVVREARGPNVMIA